MTGVETQRGAQAVGRAMAVLDSFQQHATLSVTEVARLLDLNAATAHRLLRALLTADFLGQDAATSRYHLGPGLAAAGAVAARRLGYEAARPELERLASTLGWSVTLGVNRGDHSLIVETAIPDVPDAIPVLAGARTPIYACAMGKSISAYTDRGPRVDDLFTPFTAKTIASVEQLRRELATVRARGWAVNDEELHLGIRGVGAPVRDSTGAVVAAVAIAAPTLRLSDDDLEAVSSAVTASARRLGALVLGTPETSREH